jgi:predicted NBD/HSP70 family sugar kinase
MKNTTYQTSDLGKANRAAVLNLIKQHGTISRAELVKKTKLAGPSVSRIVQSLIQEGLVDEIGVGRSIGGRKPILLTLRPYGRLAVGLDIRPQFVDGVVCGLDGSVVCEHRTPLEPGMSADDVVAKVIGHVRELLGKGNVDGKALAGIGLSIPGLVDQHTNIVRFSPPAGWRNMSVKKPLMRHFKVPVMIENTVEVMALAEKVMGEPASRDTEHLVYLYVGLGIGAGIIRDGTLFHGPRYSGVELGHTTIDLHGPRCRCGNYGCLEAVASQTALLDKANRHLQERGLPPVSTLEELRERVRDETAGLGAVFSEMATYLGVGVANIMNIFNPDVVVLGGWPSLFKDQVFEQIRHVALSRSLEGIREGVAILPSETGENSVVLGAASLIIQAFFNGELDSKNAKRM